MYDTQINHKLKNHIFLILLFLYIAYIIQKSLYYWGNLDTFHTKLAS